MKTRNVIFSAVAGVALCGSAAIAQVTQQRTTTTTTYDGTVSELSPTSSTMVIKSESAPAPVTYKYNKTTTWVDSSGSVITAEQARNSPVTVHYVKDGDSMVVTKVVASKPSVTTNTTTTTTETNKQ